MDAVEYWMNELANRSSSTKKKYSSYLKLFSEWCGKTPDEFIVQRKVDFKSDDPKEQRKIETSLKGFIRHLEEEGFSISTQQVAYAAVRSFFEMHYLPLRMRRGDYPSGESLGYRAATRENINRLLENASDRTQAIILFLKDTGLRVSDVVSLKYGDLAKGLEEEAEFIPLNIITKKNSIAAKTFVGPEAITALKKRLKERREGTRRIPQEKITKDSPLFRTKSKKVAPVSRSGISSLINHHVKKIGLEGEISAHSLRKFFQTQMEAAGVHPNWVEQMMGHKLSGVRNSYSRPSSKQLEEVYGKAYPQLSVFPIPATAEEMRKQAEELKKAKSEVQELRNKTQKLEENAERTQEMFKKMMSAVLGSEAEFRFKEVKREGKDKIRLTLRLSEKDLKKLRNHAREVQKKEKTKPKLQYTDVVKVDKHDIETVVKLIKKGYEMTFENGKHAIFTKK